MASVKDLFYDIESLFIEGASANEIATQLSCPIEYVRQVLSTFGVEDCDMEDYYGA